MLRRPPSSGSSKRGRGVKQTVSYQAWRRGRLSSFTALGTVLAGMALAPGEAVAACSGLPADNSDNTILCDTGDDYIPFSGFGGNDTITIDNGRVFNGVSTDFIAGGTGNDVFFINGGRLRDLNADAGNDTIHLGNSGVGTAIIDNSIRGHAGNDVIDLNAGTVGGNVHGDEDMDVMTLSGATVNQNVFGGSGNDELYIKSGSVGQQVQSGGGDDSITIGDPANSGGAGPTIGTVVDGFSDNDKILIISGSMGSVTGNTGNDTIWLYGGSIVNAVTGAAGEDTIILGGVANSDIIPTGSSYLGTQTAGSSLLSINGNEGNDSITLISGTITSTGNAVTGDDGDDTITLDGVAMNGSILGEAGLDTFHIRSGSTIALDGGTDSDGFFLSGGQVVGSVNGGDGNDSINLGYTEAGTLTAGTNIGGNVLGGQGDDLITWWSGAFSGTINGGSGSDIVAVQAASGYDGTQTLDGGDDTGTADAQIDELTIYGKTVSLSGSTLINWERIVTAGGGLTLTDGALEVGDADVSSGLFLTGGAYLHSSQALNLTGNLNIATGSSLAQLAGNSHAISGGLTNAGTVNLQDGGAGDVLSVGGDYVGGGRFLVDIDGDIADVMTVGGNVTGSPTEIVTTAIGNGTTGIPIEVVRVTGTTAAGDFTAAGFDLGAFSYSLQLDGSTWQFVATEITDGGTLYPTVGGLLGLFAKQTVATHFQRSGSWSRARATGEEASPDGAVSNVGADRGNVWLRGIGQWADGEGELTAAAGGKKDHVSYDRDLGGLQGGLDFVMVETASYLVTGGIFGQGGRMSSDARNDTLDKSAGSAEVDAWGFGGKLGFDTANSYSEVVGGWNFYDVTAETAPGAKSDTDGNGYFLSVEAGREFALSNAVSLVPQAQFALLGTDIDNFADSAGVKVVYDGGDMAIGRLGLALDALAGTPGGQPLRLTGIVNYWYEFSDNPETSVGGTPMELDQANGSLEGGAGFHWGTDNDPLHLHGEVTYRDTVGGDGEQAWNATLGARVAF